MDDANTLRLRKQALDILGLSEPLDAEITTELLFELNTHRVELELQNDELVRAHAALQASLHKYSGLYEGAPVGYLTLDPNGRINECNKRTARLFKQAKEKIIGQKLSEFVESDDQDILHLHRIKLQETGQRQLCTLRLKKSCGDISSECSEGDDSLSHVQLESTITASREGKEVQILTILSDVTELTRAKTEIAILANERQERDRKRIEELEQARHQLMHTEKLSVIGTLAASIAHELNNPLQGLSNIIKGIRRRVTLEPEDAELVELAVDECARMTTLLSALRDFNRPTSGVRAPLRLCSTLESVLLLFKKELATKKITVDVYHEEDQGNLYGVSDQIKQVVMNLVRNSVDACTEGGRISIRTECHRSFVILEVADNGTGIDPLIQDHIFDPFFSTKLHTIGTGLGLSVSYGIIKKHNGTIEVDSSPNKSTRFRVKLPVRGPGRRPDWQPH